MYPVYLVGEKTILREFTPQDANQTFALVGDDRVTTWLSFNSRTREQTQQMLEGIVERAQLDPRTEYYLAVHLPDTDQLVGFARLALDGVRAAKLGYAIQADKWGHGYATDAARTMLRFGFHKLDLHRISAAIGPDNHASIAVVRHLGFRHEGTIRDHVFTNGHWRNSELYSVLADEWATNADKSIHAKASR